MLKKQLAQAKELGFDCFAASELEYYVFEDGYREASDKHYQDLQPAGWYLEDYHIMQGTRTEFYTAEARRHLKNSGIPVENSKGEWGLGQHELNVRYAEAMEMADRHVIFKQCLKELADEMGISGEFYGQVSSG